MRTISTSPSLLVELAFNVILRECVSVSVFLKMLQPLHFGIELKTEIRMVRDRVGLCTFVHHSSTSIMTGFVHDYDNSGVNRIFKNVDIKFFSIFELFISNVIFFFMTHLRQRRHCREQKKKKWYL